MFENLEADGVRGKQAIRERRARDKGERAKDRGKGVRDKEQGIGDEGICP
jgi:hypothetical protein